MLIVLEEAGLSLFNKSITCFYVFIAWIKYLLVHENLIKLLNKPILCILQLVLLTDVDIIPRWIHLSFSFQNCWNCGRKAGQTCSGCGLARYCGVFCQHKDWSKHRTACGLSQSSSTEKPLNIKTEPESTPLFLTKNRPSPKSVW